jgi:hypothetical protein
LGEFMLVPGILVLLFLLKRLELVLKFGDLIHLLGSFDLQLITPFCRQLKPNFFQLLIKRFFHLHLLASQCFIVLLLDFRKPYLDLIFHIGLEELYALLILSRFRLLELLHLFL